jgi:molybdopterin/thiamine biosynthesis adenylyltransferase
MPDDLSPDNLSTAEWERYARQIGEGVLAREGQARLRRATVLVTRVGGMGGPAAQSLVMAGVGTLILAHSGELISPDLNRQVLGSEAGVGAGRAKQFAERLRSLNRFVRVEAIDHEPHGGELDRLVARCDVVIAAPPNFQERIELNRAAVRARTPLVDAAQWAMTGTLTAVDPGRSACLECIYPEQPPFEALFPVVGAISSAIGALAALEAIKIIARAGEPLYGRMMVIDGLAGTSRVLDLRRDPKCRVCSGAANMIDEL